MANMLSWLTGREDQTVQPVPFTVNDGQPSLRAYNPTPSERVGSWIQDLLMSGGAQAYPAGHVAHGMRDLLSMSPLGIGMSAADVLHAKSAGDPMGAAAAAIGMVPGLKPEVQAIRQGIRAYHGSPHDFDKFDLSKIGTGEGAQSYGHGLYFAENEGVAREYRQALSDIDYKNPQAVAAEYLRMHGGDREKALAELRDHAVNPFWVKSSDEDTAKGIREGYQLLKNNPDIKPGVAPGRMYEVNINAKPEQFLDWDAKNFNQQPLSVQNAVLPFVEAVRNRQLTALDQRAARGTDAFGRPFSAKDRERMEINRAHGIENWSGDELYKKLGAGARNQSEGYAQVTNTLGNAGIPGIRYLDQGSRNNFNKPEIEEQIARIIGAHGEQPFNPAIADMLKGYKSQLEGLKNQTSNYVLFNDQLVDIMRKYGLAAPAAAGAASYAMAPQEAQAGKAQAAQFQQPAPLSDRINQMIDSLQWGDQWQGRMKLPLERKVNNMLGESIWPPLR